MTSYPSFPGVPRLRMRRRWHGCRGSVRVELSDDYPLPLYHGRHVPAVQYDDDSDDNGFDEVSEIVLSLLLLLFYSYIPVRQM